MGRGSRWGGNRTGTTTGRAEKPSFRTAKRTSGRRRGTWRRTGSSILKMRTGGRRTPTAAPKTPPGRSAATAFGRWWSGTRRCDFETSRRRIRSGPRRDTS
jgi:hypothetical protein